MIVKETVVINGKQFTKTYSDENRYIECNSVRYYEAFDPAEISREYTETKITIGDDEATEADYINSLEELGVKFGEERSVE